jgi:adenosylhomocysteine nucleosidase
MPRIAIVAALEREIRPLVRHWRVTETKHENHWFRFFEKGEAVAVCGGIGAGPARRAAEVVIALYLPEMIWSAGFAGALTSELKVGDIVVPRRVISAGDGSIKDTERGEGALISVDMVASADHKSKLRDSYAAQSVDMEAAAVGRAAEARGIAFAAVKTISDESDFSLPAMDRFITATGEFRTGKFAGFVLVRPWFWADAILLARNSSRAAHALCEWLEGMIESATREREGFGPQADPLEMKGK